MKKRGLLLGLVAAALVAAAGCSKQKPPPSQQFNGVTVDIPKLNQAFANAPQELRSTAAQVGFNLRYQKFEGALMALDKLVNDPNVNADQKKVVNEVIEQVKKLAGAAPAQ